MPVEFTFDIFKMTKGEQNKGVGPCSSSSRTTPRCAAAAREGGEWQWADSQGPGASLQDAVKELQDQGINPRARPGDRRWAAVNQLAEEFGFYEISGKEVFDYQVMGVEIPPGCSATRCRATRAARTHNAATRCRAERLRQVRE